MGIFGYLVVVLVGVFNDDLGGVVVCLIGIVL